MERTFYNESELRKFAAEFGRALRPGNVVGLSGPLGSGKTTFVRAVVAARFGSDPVSSPSFTFWHRYVPAQDAPPTAVPIDHLDFYRVENPRELIELGLEDAFDGGSIVLVEWWRNAADLLPELSYEVEIDGKGDEARRVRIRDAST